MSFKETDISADPWAACLRDNGCWRPERALPTFFLAAIIRVFPALRTEEPRLITQLCEFLERGQSSMAKVWVPIDN